MMTGRTLGPYQVVAGLGAGGMGEVYEARDTRLNRMVALKILPPVSADNADRRRRFLQEAQLASSLQHPHIVTIYDIGSDAGTDYLAMELVRGRTLDNLIGSRGLRLNDALRYAIQIADALAAAHRAGIVHRDLKPANIMVTEQGQIKVLDFGLATLAEAGLASDSLVTTLHAPVVETGAGTILGTVAYMSPEQAEGRPVDARSDLFSLGAILYEMLSGNRAFRADSAAGTLAAVINAEPPRVGTVAPHVPEAVERLVSRCLRKDIEHRAQSASDVKVLLEELLEDSTSGAFAASRRTVARRRWPAAALAGVAAVGLTASVMWWPRAPAAPRPAAFTAMPLASLPGSETNPTFSPDGSQVAYQWQPEEASTTDVYLQLVGQTGTPRRLTDDGAHHAYPSWSPDGRSIALWHVGPGPARAAPARLSVVSPLGGERQIIEWIGPAGPIAWSPDGRWLATSNAALRADSVAERGIVLVAVATGERVEWAAIDRTLANSSDPAFSPDGRRVAFTRRTGEFTGELYVVPVGADGRPTGPAARLPYDGHELRSPVWTADGTEILVLEGSPTSNGGVARVPADGAGPLERLGGLSHATAFTLSRDGTKLAFARASIDSDVWRLDLVDPASSRAIARSTMWDGGAGYSPDGQRIAFSSNRGGGREIWVADADGQSAHALTNFGGPVAGSPRWSPDGRQIAFDSRPDGNSDVFVIPAAGGALRQLTRQPGEDARPTWSHDGRFIYFSSDRSGRNEIWRMTAEGGDPVQITRDGGIHVVTSPDAEHLYYRREGPGIYRMRLDGSGDAVFLTDMVVPFMSFTATARSLWFAAVPAATRPYWSIQTKDATDGTVREVTRLDFPPGSNLNISVSPDERYVLITRPDTRGTDLLLVEDFQ
jgi:eukaryotic-like serine/threonine-protein kinase